MRSGSTEGNGYCCRCILMRSGSHRRQRLLLQMYPNEVRISLKAMVIAVDVPNEVRISQKAMVIAADVSK